MAGTFGAETEPERDQSGIGIKVARAPLNAKPSLPPAAARFGRYDVIGRVAVGGMAEIFLARETLPGGALRQCALKVLKRSVVSAEDERYFEELFWRECRTAVQLAHPNICHVYEFGKNAGRFFIAMEWIDGRPLSEVLVKLLERGELLSPGMAVGIVAQVASALHYAHTARDARNRALNVVHRDVNPQNIMLRHDGSVKLVDFGVAHVSEAEQDSRAETIKGKPAYMAPEQLLGKDIDGRADVFALGVCLYEMLTGERLHKRGSMRETLTAVMRELPATLHEKRPELPPALDAVVQRALTKQPESRYASAGDFQAALEGYLAERGEIGSAREVGGLMKRLYPNAKDAMPQLDTSVEVLSYLTRSDVAELQPVPRQRPGLSLRLFISVAVLFSMAALGYALWSSAREQPEAAPAATTGAPATPPTQALPAQPAPAAPPTEPAVQPDNLAVPETTTTSKASPLDEIRAKRRRHSPGFVADPGF